MLFNNHKGRQSCHPLGLATYFLRTPTTLLPNHMYKTHGSTNTKSLVTWFNLPLSPSCQSLWLCGIVLLHDHTMYLLKSTMALLDPTPCSHFSANHQAFFLIIQLTTKSPKLPFLTNLLHCPTLWPLHFFIPWIHKIIAKSNYLNSWFHSPLGFPTCPTSWACHASIPWTNGLATNSYIPNS